jgi:hypothetical protein
MTAEFTYEQLLAVFEAAGSRTHTADGEIVWPTPLVDWVELFARQRPETDWLAAPILPRGRSVALFAKGGTGKSLFVLWLVAAMATGREIFGAKRPPADVLYLDYEMTEDDLLDRLEAMGYSPDDLGHLHYALLPRLAPLDGREGGEAVAVLAELVAADVVVIDTFGRAVSGDENEADTVRAWYRWTGQRLKRDGRAFIRIDHAGKNLELGQRGSSAKNDDVDVVWQMTELEGKRYRLTAVKRRLDSIPPTVEVDQIVDEVGLNYRLVAGTIDYPAGTAKVSDDLDRLGVALSSTRDKAAEVLRAAGCGARTGVVGAALRYRRERVVIVVPEAPEPPFRERTLGTDRNRPDEPDESAGQPSISGSRNRREPDPKSMGAGGWFSSREPPAPDPIPGLFDELPEES